MKKFLLVLILVIVLPLTILLGVLFFRPLLIINPDNIAWVFNKTNVFEKWSWKKALLTHERISLLDRRFTGDFSDFCFKLDRTALKLDTCLEKLSWDINLHISLLPKATTNAPFFVRSSFTDITPGKTEVAKEEKTGPPDIWGYWNMLWNEMIPDMDLAFQKITIQKEEPLELDLSLVKVPKDLTIKALGFVARADPAKIAVLAPPRWKLPKDLGTVRPVYFKDFQLSALMKEEGISLELAGYLETIKVSAESFIDLPLKDELSSVTFRKKALLMTSAVVELRGLKESLLEFGPPPYNELPAPLNSMDGDIILRVKTRNDEGNKVLLLGDLAIDLKSSTQVVDLNLFTKLPVDAEDFSRGTLWLDLLLNRLKIELPRLSKKELPPQFKPDGRFKKHEDIGKAAKPPMPINIHLVTDSLRSLAIKTNLLDEPLRIDMDLNIKNSLKKGFVDILPLKTTVFKRPIKMEKMHIEFEDPQSPVLTSTVVFPLPEYKITMNIEGPMSRPRYAFKSEPPLPESDIYAVLLFGRPMADLGPEDKSSAGRTNQILSQGLLSLSTLYFLSGSPVEYVGYDPDSKNAMAQIGLGKKNSLRVSGGESGVNSTAIRRSLGKGWYLDTSVGNPASGSGRTPGNSRNYGVLLERIMAY